MEIKIIETSDMHGYVLPTNYTERNMDLGFSTAKAATVIQRLKQEAKGPVIQIENGDFIHAFELPKEERATSMPCTPYPRTSGPMPHPLFDNLSYVSRDYQKFIENPSSKDRESYGAYKELLAKWVQQEDSPLIVRAVYAYISQCLQQAIL